jgi:beta-aspartyl-peptidase (threonine type)
MTPALIAHGGAGSWRPGTEEDAVAGMKAAVEAGRAVLLAGGSALDAVCATVVALEDNPNYNAGTGGVLNFDGFVELDASVMVSEHKRFGAVTGLQRVKNPVLVARKVMEETDHAMLTGEGALRFARAMGFGDHDPVTDARHADWRQKRALLEENLKGGKSMRTLDFLRAHPDYAGGTVGAAAVDSQGVLAAATSTGGVTMKLVGRVGDSPIPGAGNYATELMAASATGTGEYVLRSLSTRQMHEAMSHGDSLDEAMAQALAQLKRDFDGDIGIVAVDREGRPVARHLSKDMPHAYFSGRAEVVARMRVA